MALTLLSLLSWATVHGFVVPLKAPNPLRPGASGNQIYDVQDEAKQHDHPPVLNKRREKSFLARNARSERKMRWLSSAMPKIMISLALASSLWITPASAKGGGSHSSIHRSSSSRSSSSRSRRSSRSSSRSSSSKRASSSYPSTQPRSSPSSPSPSYKRPTPKSTPARQSRPRLSPTPPTSSPVQSKTSTPNITAKKRIFGHAGGRARKSSNKSSKRTPMPSTSTTTPRTKIIYRNRPATVHVHHYSQPPPTVLYQEPLPHLPGANVSPIDYSNQPPPPPPPASALESSPGDVDTATLVPTTVRHNPWPDRLLGSLVGAGMATTFLTTTTRSDSTSTTTTAAKTKRKMNVNEDENNDMLSTFINKYPSIATGSLFPSLLGNDATGWYTGTTTESDGTQQSVRVHLNFHNRNHMVRGHGSDTEDGDYTIVLGVWRDNAACWLEEYDTYEVLVYAQRDLSSESKIKWKCTFASTVDNITGDFELTKMWYWTEIKSRKFYWPKYRWGAPFLHVPAYFLDL